MIKKTNRAIQAKKLRTQAREEVVEIKNKTNFAVR